MEQTRRDFLKTAGAAFISYTALKYIKPSSVEASTVKNLKQNNNDFLDEAWGVFKFEFRNYRQVVANRPRITKRADLPMYPDMFYFSIDINGESWENAYLVKEDTLDLNTIRMFAKQAKKSLKKQGVI
jgi:hypothetical protein